MAIAHRPRRRNYTVSRELPQCSTGSHSHSGGGAVRRARPWLYRRYCRSTEAGGDRKSIAEYQGPAGQDGEELFDVYGPPPPEAAVSIGRYHLASHTWAVVATIAPPVPCPWHALAQAVSTPPPFTCTS
jgi:hypothetical protein